MSAPADIRRQLDLPHKRARALARETLGILGAGEYVAHSGRRVSIAGLMETANENTVEYGPADVIPPSVSERARQGLRCLIYLLAGTVPRTRGHSL